MVESAYLRKGDDLSELLPVHEPRLGRILAKREVGSRAVVVPGVVRIGTPKGFLGPRNPPL